MATTLFENSDLRLSSTGHDYDFVGTIEVLSDKPLTFFFAETLCQVIDEDGTEYDEWEPDESATRLLDVYAGLKPYDEDTDDDNDEAENVANCLYHGEDIDHIDYFTQTKEEGWSGFLSDPKQRGWFLALIKNYCPEKLADIPWAA